MIDKVDNFLTYLVMGLCKLVMIALLVMVIVFIAKFTIDECSASELKMLDLRYEEAVGTNRSFEYKEKKKGELGLHFNYKLLSFVDLDTTVSSKIEQSQFRYVELEPYFNVHATDSITLYAHHRSGHCLDCTYDNIKRFPNENGVGVKLILFGGK